MHQFACPQCGARLRLKDKSFAGRTVNCPDCREPITIQLAADGSLTGITASQDATTGSGHAPPPGAARSSAGRSALRRVSPALAAWLIALGCLAALLFYVFGSGSEQTSPEPPDVAQADAQSQEQPPEPAPPAETPEARLTVLARHITAYRDGQNLFPSTPVQPGIPADKQFGWMADLAAAQSLTGLRPDWDDAWNDPVNDRFVRQRIETFQNPNIKALTGPAGHPVSHFAGIAGVGADAAGLPTGHPRAGIFGTLRTTRPEDVQDGLSSTMMVAGVQTQLDSWAANGRATVRPLSAEPYFDGPDGFGTGEQGGMSVLMADGSVRFLSADTDPRLMRRMAAMADGLPLDLKVPGEPGEASKEPPSVALETPPSTVPDGPDAEPIDVPLAVDEPLFDMDAALGQPIVEFNQSTPRPVGEILQLIAELAGVAVDTTRLDAASSARLEDVTTFALQKTTVRDVLDAAVNAAGLSYAVGDGVVVLTAAEP